MEAKAKQKLRHERALLLFKKWIDENPKATRKEKIETFDRIIDAAAEYATYSHN